MKIAWILAFFMALLVFTASAVSAANLITNPGFSGSAGWNFYTNGVGSFAAAGSGVVSITTKGTNTQLFQHGIALKPNTDYKLTFQASSSKDSDMQVYLHKHGSPYTNYGLSWNVPVTINTQTFTRSFKTTASASSDARLRFWLIKGLNGEKYTISNVILEATGNSTPIPDTLSVTHSPISPVTGDTVTITATASKTSTVKVYVDDALKKTCTSATTCSHSDIYTGTHTYYATTEAGSTLRDPTTGTKSFTVTPYTPPPSTGGKVFKEFYATMSESSLKDWRVTDPNATATGSPNNNPKTYLPNSKISINVNDLANAKSAEAIVDMWGGHVGTTGQKLKFNNNAWLTIPQLSGINGIPSGSNGECYAQQRNTAVPVPVSHLKTGTNIFEGTAGKQTCYSFNWGQWGWYGLVLRVYYDESKPHPTGSITSPSNNGIIGENPTINVQASSPVGIEKVEVIAYYDGPDYDGDGIYKEWQESYRKLKGQNVIAHQYIVGTDTTAPYSFVWDTSMVPDQDAGAIKLKARIKDKNGVWYETNEITGLTLQRSGSVKLYQAASVPQKFWVRAGEIKSSTFTIPSTHNIGQATSAKLLVHTWNGIDGEAGGATHYTKVNSWTAPLYGQNHYYSFDALTMPASSLKTGTNTVTFNSNSVHHGIEITWPGPSMIVRYGSKQSP